MSASKGIISVRISDRAQAHNDVNMEGAGEVRNKLNDLLATLRSIQTHETKQFKTEISCAEMPKPKPWVKKKKKKAEHLIFSKGLKSL